VKTGRNAPCPCGSGLKYKQCCLNKAKQPAWRTKLAIVAVVLLVAGGLVLAVIGLTGSEPAERQRVWSEEHQHWHYVE
jgi:hypothetical protein